MASFEQQVAAFARKANKNIDKTMRAVSIKLFGAIIDASPVGQYTDGRVGGRFRANWQASGAVPIATTVSGTANPKNEVAGTVASMASAKEFTLSNNLPYAAVIEFGGYPGDGPNTVGGFSKQAPQGVVRVNTIRFQRLLDEAARENQ